MKALTQRIGDVLAVLSGARLDLLRAAPGARPRYVALGGVLLSTGGMALLSASFAVHMALGAAWPIAVLIGLFWGVVIVNLDRALLVGMAHDSSVWRNLGMAVPRLLLALVLGTVIATPLTLQVFHKEIDAKVVQLQEEKAAQNAADLASDPRLRQLPGAQNRVATDHAIIDTGGQADPALQPVQDRVTAAQKAYNDALAQYRELQAQAQCELNGTCGTHVPGEGDAYQQANAAAEQQAIVVANAKKKLDTANAALADAEARSVKQATANLKPDTEELTALQKLQREDQSKFDGSNSQDDGILIRLEALSRLGAEDSTMGMAHLLLSLLFISVELLPVVMKVLLNLGPATAYDRLAVLRDEADIANEELQHKARISVVEAQAELTEEVGRDRVDRQRRAAMAVNREVVDQQSRVIKQALRVWGTHAREAAADKLKAYDEALRDRRERVPAPNLVEGSTDWGLHSAPGAGLWGQPRGTRAPSPAPWSDDPSWTGRPAASSRSRSSSGGGNSFVMDTNGLAWLAPRRNSFLANADLDSPDDI